MDFKVCGTAKGVTAIQMDIKIAGPLARGPRAGARAGARGARLTSSTRCSRRSPTARPSSSKWAPRITHDQGQARPDPPHHRPRRQDNQGHHRPDRRRHRRRGRRHGQRRLERHRRREEGARHHQGPHGGARGRRDLQGHRVSASPTSARSSRSSRAPTASSTSRRWRTRASSKVTDVMKEGDAVEVKVSQRRPRRQDPPDAPRAPAVPRGSGGRRARRANPAGARGGRTSDAERRRRARSSGRAASRPRAIRRTAEVAPQKAPSRIARGSVNRNVVVPPGRLSAVMLPPWASTSSRAM